MQIKIIMVNVLYNNHKKKVIVQKNYYNYRLVMYNKKITCRVYVMPIVSIKIYLLDSKVNVIS